MKQNLDFYSHNTDSHEHDKFYFLRSRYGWAGEGMFWALNNMIGKSENCVLNLDRRFSKAPIAEKFGQTIQEFDEFIDFLLKDCELIMKREDGITTEILQEIYEKVSTDRERGRNYKKKNSPIKKKPVQSTNPESKEEDSKIKKRIDYNKIISEFNVTCTELSSIKTIANQRKNHVSARIKENGLESMYEVFKLTSDSDFLNGKVKAWKASFDWMMNPNNYIKILEGNYKNKGGKSKFNSNRPKKINDR